MGVPFTGRAGHLVNTSNFDSQIVEQGVKVDPHMLRKGFTTTAKLLCSGFVVDILTAHIPTGSFTDKNYTIPSPEELRPFTEQIEKELLVHDRTRQTEQKMDLNAPINRGCKKCYCGNRSNTSLLNVRSFKAFG